MPSEPRKLRRRSIRLKDYDYAQAGAYFVTICTQGRRCLFGDVAQGDMRLNDAGRMVTRWWEEVSARFSSVQSDLYAVMPNHFHGIVMMVGADPRVRPDDGGAHAGAPLPRTPLSHIVRWFKTMTTNEYIQQVKVAGWPAFPARLWQRNYYEHVIRNSQDLNDIRRYIAENPRRWETDSENPEANEGR